MTPVKKVYTKVYYQSGDNDTYYSLGNIGWWLSGQRQRAGVTRTAVAVAMGWPGGAVKALEEGRRIPEATTVQKYLLALKGIDINVGRSVPNNMYERFHS